MKTVEAKKLDMTQIFSEDGKVTPVTLVRFEEMPQDLVIGSAVKIVGTSKGKGFAGVMKRHGFKGMKATHGRSTKGRAPGSIGQTTTPGRVYKGKRMAGRMGGERITVQGLSVVQLDPEQKTATISGALPGPRLSRLVISYEPQEQASSQESVVSSVEDGAISDKQEATSEEEKKEEAPVATV
ncbi:50S ribosomal protein L3 [candidate division WWE3 bacterium RIFCSPHIGHO2_01_FULL_48_15]|uniref:Large ribosomal subunit protein uL3 n=1 Tax=candidate division WWE3 bacterium RIFCSPHIGHO2_01_FULL_48_15 TaxID=1802619 RepID=A0A1F4V9U5_UNCKA|nr:MAG: 50S ribosomal protein L3 [candidate division WWE3 bacterium RIFCSPHIGHO2_01_FULL_48_15]